MTTIAHLRNDDAWTSVVIETVMDWLCCKGEKTKGMIFQDFRLQHLNEWQLYFLVDDRCVAQRVVRRNPSLVWDIKFEIFNWKLDKQIWDFKERYGIDI